MSENRKAELKAAIEIADRVLRETRGTYYIKDYRWLQNERARLVRELSELERRREGAQP
jgi:hypothetical protein